VVLGADQQVQEGAGDVLGAGAEAPDSARGGQQGDEAALAVEDLGADGVQAGQVGGEEAV